METSDDIQKEINEWAPGFPVKPTIAPPEGYFTELPDRMIQRWGVEATQTKQRRITFQRWLAVAAITVGSLIGGWCWLQSSPGSPALQGISSEEAFAYIQENIYDFDELLQQEVTWPDHNAIQLPDSSAIEEYLLEELQYEDFEQLF